MTHVRILVSFPAESIVNARLFGLRKISHTMQQTEKELKTNTLASFHAVPSGTSYSRRAFSAHPYVMVIITHKACMKDSNSNH